LVSNHATGKFVWGKEGKDTATLDCFFDELGEERSAAITAVSMDMGAAFEKSARKEGHATKAVICFDPFHVVQAGTQALEKVRRQVWTGSAPTPRPGRRSPVQGRAVVSVEEPR
jgi:transposase